MAPKHIDIARGTSQKIQHNVLQPLPGQAEETVCLRGTGCTAVMPSSSAAYSRKSLAVTYGRIDVLECYIARNMCTIRCLAPGDLGIGDRSMHSMHGSCAASQVPCSL